MSTPRRPSMVHRTMSTPLTINVLQPKGQAIRATPLTQLGLNVLTPPPSPQHSRSSSNLSNKIDDPNLDAPFNCPYEENRQATPNIEPQFIGQTKDEMLICPCEVELLKDRRDRNQIFGYGAWSTVFKGTCHTKPASGLLTPPLSPLRRPPLLVAVKQPSRRDANAILESEAKVLTYLMSKSENEHYVVPFFGLLQSTSSLVLAAVPLSLDEHIKKCAQLAHASRTTWNMSEPVVGDTTVWCSLALKLTSALSWLHDSAMVVHGDIKPGNILLDRLLYREEMDIATDDACFPYEPLFADFSSSQRLDADCTPNTLSAITREYTAPELLSSKVLSDPNSTATTASDVFSLAVTLLVAATGNTMVYSGSVFQRQAMATQGWMVIQAARNGPMEEGARVPRKGVVERALEKAVLRAGTGRVEATAWRSQIEDLMRQQQHQN